MATIAEKPPETDPDREDFSALPDVSDDVFTAPLKRPAHVGEDWLEP
jgi:phenylalanine-4-hydroxylase